MVTRELLLLLWLGAKSQNLFQLIIVACDTANHFLLLLLRLIYLSERDKDRLRTWVGEGQKEKKENLKQSPCQISKQGV